MNSEKPTEELMWWPSHEAMKDLTIEESEDGFILEAPDGTECAEWLDYWNQSEAKHQVFTETFVGALKAYIELMELKHGETEAVTDEQDCNRTEAEADLTGSES